VGLRIARKLEAESGDREVGCSSVSRSEKLYFLATQQSNSVSMGFKYNIVLSPFLLHASF
jgi:hypothetical protein